MTISTGAYMRSFYDATSAQGGKVISSDFTFEIEGFEQTYLLVKQAPWPELSAGEAIEVASVLGSARWEKAQARFHQQGPISLMETVTGAVDKLLLDLIARGGEFNAKVYEGTPQNYLRAKVLRQCTLSLDTPDRDWENRQQILLLSGTIFFHYFGEVLPGNSADYR